MGPEMMEVPGLFQALADRTSKLIATIPVSVVQVISVIRILTGDPDHMNFPESEGDGASNSIVNDEVVPGMSGLLFRSV